ncbi:multidrug effflux MFS transporter [Pseudomonas sp. X10]
MVDNASVTQTVAPIEQQLTRSQLLLLAGLAALGALSTNIMLPSFPSIAQALQVPTSALGMTLSSFFVAFAVGQLAVGPLSDRYGRRSLVLGGLAIFLVGSVLCASATEMPTLIVGRIVQALGVCAASVLSRAIARDLFAGEALARVLALTMVAMSAAPGFSPLLGGALEQAFGWRAAFIFVAIIGIVLAAHYVLVIGETHPVHRRAPISLRTIAYGYAKLAGNRLFIRPALAVSLIIGALYAFFATAPAILMEILGLSAIQLGLFFAATVLVVFAAGMLAPRMAHRYGARSTATAGFGIALLGGLALVLSASHIGLLTFSMAITIFLFGMGLANPLGTAAALQPFGQQAGLASALLGFLQMGCAAAVIAVASALPVTPVASLGWVLTGASLLAVFLMAYRGSLLR